VVGASAVGSLFGILYYTWSSQSNSVGSGNTGGKIAPIVHIKPNPSDGDARSAAPQNKECTAPPGSIVSQSISRPSLQEVTKLSRSLCAKIPIARAY
jgi:hypothetical protein